jgi:serine/threonine protein kinase
VIRESLFDKKGYTNVALKVIKKRIRNRKTAEIELLIKELRAMRELFNQKLIVQLLAIFESQRHIVIAMEYVGGGDLQAKYSESHFLNL